MLAGPWPGSLAYVTLRVLEARTATDVYERLRGMRLCGKEGSSMPEVLGTGMERVGPEVGWR